MVTTRDDLQLLWGEGRAPVEDAVEVLDEDGAPVGVVEVELLGDRLRCAWAQARPGAGAALIGALAAMAREPLVPRRLEVVVDGTVPDGLDAVLRAAGLAPVIVQLHLHGPLPDAPAPSPWRHRPVTVAGRRTLLWLLERIWAGGTPLGLSPAAELRDVERVCAAGRVVPDRSLWRLAEHDGRLAGVALAHRDPADPGVGSLAALGIVPELRGRGLGAALHHDALWRLREAGAVAYRESTAEDNAPMLALLRRAACEVDGRTTVYALPTGREAAASPLRRPQTRSTGFL